MFPELIGYSAGVIGVTANTPQLFDLLRHPEKRMHQNLLRNILLSTSNALWMFYGTLIGAWPVVVMCAVATFMLVMITLLVLRVRLIALTSIRTHGKAVFAAEEAHGRSLSRPLKNGGAGAVWRRR